VTVSIIEEKKIYVMDWNRLTSAEQLQIISEESKKYPVVIFKHSTSCSISRMMLDRFERNWKADEVPNVKAYYLDLKAYRGVSNSVASVFDTEHESPQLLIIRNGRTVHVASHSAIDFNDVKEAAAE
jgi:bacillithiol system protein YtxJ